MVLGKIDTANIADGKAKHPKSQIKATKEIKEKPLQINTPLIWTRPSSPLSSSPIQVTPQQAGAETLIFLQTTF